MSRDFKRISLFLLFAIVFYGLAGRFPYGEVFPIIPLTGESEPSTLEPIVFTFLTFFPVMVWGGLCGLKVISLKQPFAFIATVVIIVLLSLLDTITSLGGWTPQVFQGGLLFNPFFVLIGWLAGSLTSLLIAKSGGRTKVEEQSSL